MPFRESRLRCDRIFGVLTSRVCLGPWGRSAAAITSLCDQPERVDADAAASVPEREMVGAHNAACIFGKRVGGPSEVRIGDGRREKREYRAGRFSVFQQGPGREDE